MGILKKIYKKDIEREIQGVIKVDDESYISQELEEYVVTDELLKHFKSFFEAYNLGVSGNTEKMGVWISGFFGSGKSHFLKIISYLLENKKVNGKFAVDYFEDKLQDKVLLENIRSASENPTDVILFNIDSKASLDSVDGKDKILSVFEKVFNEKLGLSTIPHVAELERFLIKEEKYEEFMKIFFDECGESWELARNDFYFRRDEIVKAYSLALGKSIDEAENWFDKAEERYELSVEKFAIRVKNYLISKGNNHHVVFLVDEIGQYIGDDRSLMLNLQTIVEDLGLECSGKAWVIVTSQEAIDDVVKVKGNDFSKIQGRFDTKLSLSSSDIDEVIKLRILDKIPEYLKSLEMLYEKDQAIVRNLLTFKNASYQKIYENSLDFAKTYPFIPYHFKLLQDVFTDIREHGYAGKHLSSGERSLLGAFQETAKRYKDSEIGCIIPFYAFYDTIEQFLDHQVKNVINNANDMVKIGELKEIDLQVLKMLFMLKNIKEIPTNVDNLSTLYVSNIHDDKISIKSSITDSLRRLEAQTLIQSFNEEYKFLTDEEQEINREIKNISIDMNRITDYIKKIVFDYILTDNKFVYKNRIFPLTKYVDNIKYSQEYEIGIKVITTFLDRDDTEIVLQSLREHKYVFVKLEISTLIYDEINNYLKVEEYRRSKSGILQTPQVEDIIKAKLRQIENAELLIKDNIKSQLDDAEIIIAGDRQNINSREAKSRINEALEVVIKNVYNKFSYIEHNFNFSDIKELFYESKVNLVGEIKDFVNQKAYDAIKEYCEEKNELNISITIKSILQNFEIAPYGFLEEDVLYILTKLLKDDVIVFIYNNENQNMFSETTLNKILKKEFYDRTIVKLRTKIPFNLINDLKSVARNAFDSMDLRDDEDGMVEDFRNNCLLGTINRLKSYLPNYDFYQSYQYPGKNLVIDVIEKLENLLRIKDLLLFFEEVSNKKVELIDILPQIQMVFDFFSGIQKEQYDEARKTLLIYDNNEDYIEKNDELIVVVDELKLIFSKENPYSDIYKLPVLRKKMVDILDSMYIEKSEPIIKMAEDTILYIKNYSNENGFGSEYIDICQSIICSLKNSCELKDIYAQKARLEQLKNDFNNKLNDNVFDGNRKIVNVGSLMNSSFEINSYEDIEIYIKKLKEKLLEEFEKNKNITIR